MPHRFNMGSKTTLSTSCTKRRENPANLVTSSKVKTRLARSISSAPFITYSLYHCGSYIKCFQTNYSLKNC